MENKKWIYGWMTGVTIGFAMWGSVRIFPVEQAEILPVSTAYKTEVNASPKQVKDELKLHALSAVLIDGDSGRILYGKEEHTVRPMASTTKIMTCILALENGAMTDVCTVSKNAVSQPKVRLGAPMGCSFVLQDLLYSLMLESHNDTAVMIAEKIAGSTDAFSEMMNQKARDIGCSETFFITPNGLDAEKTTKEGETVIHSTTASDLAKIMRYCVNESPKKERFLEITRAENYSFCDMSGRYSYSCVNHNALLHMMEGALSGKTGFTGGAGYSYVAAWRDYDRTLIAALLGSGWPPHKTYKWSDVRTLFNYGKEHYHYRDVFEQPVLPEIPVKDGIEADRAELTLNLLEENQHLNLLLGENEKTEMNVCVPAALKAPVKKGDIVGNVTCTLNGSVVAVWKVYSDSTIGRRNLKYCMKQAVGKYLSLSDS